MSNKASSVNNIYQLDGRVPIAKAIPFGLQHILAMFVSNLTPITIIAAAGGLSQEEIAILLQNAMFIAGIATLIQLYPIWKIGSGLPIVMGVSFTFVTVLSTIAANYGYPTVMGAVLVGGIFEGTLGLLAKYWRKIISPIVAASVVTAIGFSLFTVGARSFGGGYHEDFGSAQNLILGTITLIVCLVWNCLAKGYLLPPVGNFFASLPDSVLGGCTIMMFGTILTSGMQMVAKAGFSQRNILMNGVFTMPKGVPNKKYTAEEKDFYINCSGMLHYIFTFCHTSLQNLKKHDKNTQNLLHLANKGVNI